MIFVFLDKLKNNIIVGNICYEKIFRFVVLNVGINQFFIVGNIILEFLGVILICVFGLLYSNDKIYMILGIFVYMVLNIVIIVIGLVVDVVLNFGYVVIEKMVIVVFFDMVSKMVMVFGSFISVIMVLYVEMKINYDGIESKFMYGGIFQLVIVMVLLDFVSGFLIGVYIVKLNGYMLQLYIDFCVEWIKGILRIFDINLNFVSGVLQVVMKLLQVWEIKKDVNGILFFLLELIVFDLGFVIDFYLVQIGMNVNVNYYFLYCLYLKVEFNLFGNNDSIYQFNQVIMLLGIGDGSKIMYLGVCLFDCVKDF